MRPAQANVMLEYSYEEADTLLSENLEGARQKLVRLAARLGPSAR